MTTTTRKFASLGTISHGTLRPEDLLSAFADELEWQLQRNGDFFSDPANFTLRDAYNNLVGEAQDCWSDDGTEIREDKEEAAQELIEQLQEVLNEFAPAYCYFGAHEGDGSDFGYWPALDAIDELPVVEDSEEAAELGEDCKSVNDHGNVTVYGGDGSILLELV